jgi:hypothetical protein
MQDQLAAGAAAATAAVLARTHSAIFARTPVEAFTADHVMMRLAKHRPPQSFEALRLIDTWMSMYEHICAASIPID